MLLSLPDIAADSSQSKCRVALLFPDVVHGLPLLTVIPNFVFCILTCRPSARRRSSCRVGRTHTLYFDHECRETVLPEEPELRVTHLPEWPSISFIVLCYSLPSALPLPPSLLIAKTFPFSPISKIGLPSRCVPSGLSAYCLPACLRLRGNVNKPRNEKLPPQAPSYLLPTCQCSLLRRHSHSESKGKLAGSLPDPHPSSLPLFLPSAFRDLLPPADIIPPQQARS